MQMRPRSILSALAAALLMLLGPGGEALAQSADPPGRVAQLSYAEGSVSFEPAGTGTWTGAVLNRPITVGDKLWADQDSRAEIDIGHAVIRLGSTTGFSFLNLDDQTAQMQVTAGTVIVHVWTLADGEHDEIDTPNLALTLEQPGTYRIEVSESGDTTIVKVQDGEALATGGGQSYPVAAQQSVTFTGTSTLSADYAMLGAPDSLDDWSMERDQEEQQQAEVAQQYVAPDMTGADDLGDYGSWQDTPDWGYAWFPTVAIGWAPYTLGSWAWISPWGWTWVDEEPWGFAPFHYGRWGYWHHRWCWVPGPRQVRPVYAPALVAWVGGHHRGLSASTGAHVGWFPLGPRDVYVPGYHASARYVRDINTANTRITNTADIAAAYEGRSRNVHYVNSAVPGAVTAVPRRIFTSAQPVAPHRVNLPRQTAVSLRASTAAPAIAPLRQSVLGVGAARIVRAPPRALIDRPVVARLAPPRAPVAFAREQAAIRANGGRPLSLAQLSRMRPDLPAARVRLAPENSGAAAAGMSAREHALQRPTLSPAYAARSDRPPWAQAQPMQPRLPMEHERAAPFAPRPEFASPARQIAAPRVTSQRPLPEPRFVQQRPPPEQRFMPQQPPVQRFVPQQRFAPPERPTPQFAPPERAMPQFAPPERAMPQFAPPERATPHFAPPERATPHFAPPSYSAPRESPPPMPRAAPARAPEPRSQGRPP
jgi:hypothetical protein